ncbi:MAG: YqgE/AlgH family protein [Acidobacteriota bacterium]|nr:YqgE/AlgH family protein [Acidobacteriota bacterium]
MSDETTITPTLLLSMPQLDDPNFGRTVVLLCEFASEGAFGLIINRPTEFPAASVVQLAPPVIAGNDLPLWIGGPVEPERGWILLSKAHETDEAREIVPGLFLSASADVLRRVLEASIPPPARVIAGYAGWGPGQLDQELSESSWLIADVDADFVFNTPASALWEASIRRLGIDPAQLQQGRGVH